MLRIAVCSLLLTVALAQLAPPLCSRANILPNAQIQSGFCPTIWARGLTRPRSIEVASNNDVLVLETNRISVWWNNGQNSATLATLTGLNHALEINGDFIYASTSREVHRWRYTPGQRSNLGASQRVLSDIPSGGHNTRTVRFKDGWMYVHCGSAGNVDQHNIHSRIHRFQLTSLPTTWNQGQEFAVGLRNAVATRFDPNGNLWSANNGVDNLRRNDLGGDIHNLNPSEGMFLVEQGNDHGYPWCWSVGSLPGYQPGDMLVQPEFQGRAPYSDAWCGANTVRPALNIEAHAAPLDVQWYTGNTFPAQYRGDAFMALHGSWNRNPPYGYSLQRIRFSGGRPTGQEVFMKHNSAGWTGPGWIRPVGIARYQCGGRDCLLVTSDTSGQIIQIEYTGADDKFASNSTAPADKQ